METITKVTSSGHKFIIDGVIDVGNVIVITVIPNIGYVFKEWLNNLEFIEEIDPEPNNCYRRFNLKIDNCGLSFLAKFEPSDENCDKKQIFRLINNIICDVEDNYEVSCINCSTILETIEEIIC